MAEMPEAFQLIMTKIFFTVAVQASAYARSRKRAEMIFSPASLLQGFYLERFSLSSLLIMIQTMKNPDCFFKFARPGNE